MKRKLSRALATRGHGLWNKPWIIYTGINMCISQCMENIREFWKYACRPVVFQSMSQRDIMTLKGKPMQYNKQGKTDYCRKTTPIGSPDNKESRIKALVDGMVKILVNIEKEATEVSRFRRLQSLSPNRHFYTQTDTLR